MRKKSLIAVILFCLITLISSLVFATNMVKGTENMLRDVGNGIQGAVNTTEDSARNAKNGIVNVVNDMGHGAENATDDVTDNMGIGGFTDNRGEGTYTASRTSAYADNAVASNNSMVWMILAVAAIIIVALVWYYGAQADTNRNHH